MIVATLILIALHFICYSRNINYQVAEKVQKTSESVIPAKAGIQHSTDFIHSNILDPGFRRGDEEFFSNLL
ncbi:MAG: hypothetical protein NUV34_04730, partial [Sulfuricaulis sp.]|nr:hypothetical protein [Sulfuricaulis sp.]